MKFVAISDTHGKHDNLHLPKGDVLIHAGDISKTGLEFEVTSFLNWFSSQDYTYKVLIAGNHDFYFERESQNDIKKLMPANIVYLNDSYTIINDIKIWGSPISPWFHNWAFNRHRGESIKRHWELIPNDTDILITHGPAFRRLDTTITNEHVGCKDLFLKIYDVKPKVHICGHIHEAYGIVEDAGIKFINASVLNEKYQVVNTPIVFEL